jgi:hypothetical protein
MLNFNFLNQNLFYRELDTFSLIYLRSHQDPLATKWNFKLQKRHLVSPNFFVLSFHP